MENLRILDVSHNSIQYLPESIGNLVYLTSFDISFNQISKLPESFGWMISLNEFNYETNKGNILENVPEKQRKNLQSIRLYFRNIIRKDPDLRCKMYDEIECQNNIRKKPPKDNNQEEQDLVLGGTVEKLVQMLTHESYSSLNYSRCFLLLYQSFCTSEEFLNLLILR